MSANHHRLFVTGVALLCAALMAVWNSGCGTQDSASPPAASSPAPGGGGNVPDPDPDTGAPTITLGDPSPATITAGSNGSVLQVTVLDADGAPLGGATVQFRITPPSVASVGSLSAVTDANGQATKTVSGLQAGVVTITASFGSVTSAARSVTVLGPNVAIAAADTAIAASIPGSGGTTVTATVTDQGMVGIPGLAVVMQNSLGTLTSVNDLGDGRYQATLTSRQIGTADVSASVLNIQSDTASISILSGALATLVLTPSPSQIVLGDTSTLSVIAEDALGNPVMGTVGFAVLTAPPGVATLSEAQVALVDGAATVVLTGVQPGTASVTATLGTASQTEEVAIVEDLAGVPVLVSIAVDPAEITVGDEVSVVTVTVTDVFGSPITDVANNVELELISGPFDVSLGGKVLGEVLLLSSSGGVVSAPLESGTLPGTVKIEARVVRKRGPLGVELITPPITPAEPAKVLIQSGPPFSMFLGRSTRIINDTDGTYTQEYFANVSDRFGNAVRDGTSVYMGQFINILSMGTTGSIAGGNTAVTSGDAITTRYPATFDALQERDTIAILSGIHRGGYMIQTTTSTEVSTRTPFGAGDPSVDYAAGNNGGTGGPVLDTGAESFTVSGKATWLNNYPVELINEPLVVHAETEGRGIGNARLFRLGYIDTPSVEIRVLGPTAGPAGTSLEFEVSVRDAGTPRIPIGDLSVEVAVDIPAASVGLGDGDFDGGMGNNGRNRVIVFTDRHFGPDWGTARFSWNVPLTAAPAATFDLTIKAGNASIVYPVAVE